MRVTAFLVVLLAAVSASAQQSTDAFEQLKSLVGDWEADLPGYGKMSNSIRLISNGKAIEETIGTPKDNETSVYLHDGTRILLTHFCAMTPDGHITRLETPSLSGAPETLDFRLVGSTNLHSQSAPHMRLMQMHFTDKDHFSETWTKSENGKDTVFDLNFTRHSGLHRIQNLFHKSQ